MYDTVWRCPRCGQTVTPRVPVEVRPTCSCGLTADGRPRLPPINMREEPKP